MKLCEVQDRTRAQLSALLDIWERYVRATHRFLSEPEIEASKSMCRMITNGENAIRRVIAIDRDGKAIPPAVPAGNL